MTASNIQRKELQALKTIQHAEEDLGSFKPHFRKNQQLLERASLESLPIFSGLSKLQLTNIAEKMDHCSFHNDQIIESVKERDRRFHLITKGYVEISTKLGNDHNVVIGTAGPGSYFGECELLSSEPHLLEIKAKSHLETLALDRSELKELFHDKPEAAFEIAKVMGERIAKAHEVIQDYASKNANTIHDSDLSFGQKVADTIASSMGSWKFIIVQSVLLAAWITANVVGTINHWDPYPFICLNLVLSFQAAYAAPIIMMSQNRLTQKDRITAEIDHNVNISNEGLLKETLHRVKRLETKLGTSS